MGSYTKPLDENETEPNAQKRLITRHDSRTPILAAPTSTTQVVRALGKFREKLGSGPTCAAKLCDVCSCWLAAGADLPFAYTQLRTRLTDARPARALPTGCVDALFGVEFEVVPKRPYNWRHPVGSISREGGQGTRSAAPFATYVDSASN